jgi:hypothetical protein
MYMYYATAERKRVDVLFAYILYRPHVLLSFLLVFVVLVNLGLFAASH